MLIVYNKEVVNLNNVIRFAKESNNRILFMYACEEQTELVFPDSETRNTAYADIILSYDLGLRRLTL